MRRWTWLLVLQEGMSGFVAQMVKIMGSNTSHKERKDESKKAYRRHKDTTKANTVAEALQSLGFEKWVDATDEQKERRASRRTMRRKSTTNASTNMRSGIL
jgi:hypothetical protein